MFLETMFVPDDNPENICYKGSILSNKKEEYLSNYVICDYPEKIFLTNPFFILDGEKILPVNLTVVSKSSKKMKYLMDSIHMEVVSYEELYNDWYEDKSMHVINELIGGKEFLGEYPNKNLYDGILPRNDESFGELTLVRVKIENIYADQGYIYLTFSGNLEGGKSKYTLTMKSKGFFLRGQDGGYGKYINANNVSEMPTWDKCSLNIVYTIQSQLNSFGSFCERNTDLGFKLMCDRYEELKDTDLEDFITNGYDFLRLVEKNNKDLTNFKGLVITYIYEE